MKITKAIFENFICLESGLNKRHVEIDFSKCKNQIILFVGPMGSGKTTILSHLIPYSHVGTLDERNSNPIIIPEEDGKKELVYDVNGTIYRIVHKYVWAKDHHSVKSFIEKDGVELNPNGNQNSFKEIVEMELGFNSDLTRLIRLGPNVANVIDLPTIGRKEYIAKMQTDSEIYLLINKEIRELSRTISSQTQLLARKLNGVSDDVLENLRTEVKKINRHIKEEEEALKRDTEERGSVKSLVSTYLGGRTTSEYVERMEFLQKSIVSLNTSIRDKKFTLDNLVRDYGEPKNVLKALGKCESDIENNKRLITALTSDREQFDKRRIELVNIINTSADDKYVDSIRDEYAHYVDMINELKIELDDFDCPYNSAEISALLREIQLLDQDLDAIVIENPESVRAVVKGGPNIVSGAKSQLDKLQGRKIKLSKEMSNLSYVGKYDVTEDLAIPKECKIFIGCPFYYTHPNTIKSKNDSDDLLAKYRALREEIEAIDVKIDTLMTYPAIYTRICACRKTFNSVVEKVKKIDALRYSSIDNILVDASKRMWYDYDQIVDTLELCVKREKLANCEVKVIELKAALDKALAVDTDKIRQEYDDVIKHLKGNEEAIHDIEESNKKIREEQIKLEDAYRQLSEIDRIKEDISKMERDSESNQKELREMKDHYESIENANATITTLQAKIDSHTVNINAYKAELTATTVKLNTLLDYVKEYDSLMADLSLINMVIDASSPKKGIPLQFVRMFLNDCVDDINDMISTVLPDVEICEFDINDTEFKIPYIKNGHQIEDVNSASQGERAIISVALSFALMKKKTSQFSDGDAYNIPLLDEIDGPIHNVNRRDLLLIISRYLKKINAEQAFFITHNDIFEGYPVDIIATSADEHLINKHGEVIVLA